MASRELRKGEHFAFVPVLKNGQKSRRSPLFPQSPNGHDCHPRNSNAGLLLFGVLDSQLLHYLIGDALAKVPYILYGVRNKIIGPCLTLHLGHLRDGLFVEIRYGVPSHFRVPNSQFAQNFHVPFVELPEVLLKEDVDLRFPGFDGLRDILPEASNSPL